MKPHLLDDVVGQDPAEDDPEAAPEDGAHRQPDADVEVGVAGVPWNLFCQRISFTSTVGIKVLI